jgi:Carboxypeptidase regulatory-like domain
MSKQFRFAALAFMPLACLPGSSIADGTAAITGVVTTSDSVPAPNASVEAVPLADDDGMSANQFHWTQADQEGRFRIALPPGRYEIRAKDEIDGYPDPNFLLSADPHSDFPIITVDSRDIPEVKVTLGTRGGILEGELLDKATRSPVPRGKVTIADARRPAVFIEVFADNEGRFRYAVPNKPVRISASAPRYRIASVEAEVTLAGGEHRRIVLELRPR